MATFYGPTSPVGPNDGDDWVNSTTGERKRWASNGWQSAASQTFSSVTVTTSGLTVTAGNVGIGIAQATNVGLYMNGAILSGSVDQIGAAIQPTIGSAATNTGTGVKVTLTASAAFTMSQGYGVYVATPSKGSATITNATGLYIQAQTAGSSGNYGIQIEAPSGASTNVGLLNNGTTSLQDVVTVCGATATPAGGSTSARLLFGTTAGFGIYYGSGAPTVSAAQGSIYIRSDGSSSSTRLYVNTTGSTTWTNFTSAA